MAVKYLNNRDLLREIHSSKNTFCSFANRDTDHQFDLIVESISEITEEKIEEARAAKVAREKKLTGTVLIQSEIPVTDLVFRVMTWEHIPLAPPKVKKGAESQPLNEIFSFSDDEDQDVIEDEFDDLPEEIDHSVLEKKDYVRVNFPPFQHYRLDQYSQPFVVGKSHWKGDLHDGHFSKEHGKMTDTLVRMFVRLCANYGTRGNWRGYTYNEDMQAQALLQLSVVGLQFNEAKSQNPFSYLTSIVHNSFTRILNMEKKVQVLRDDLLEMNGLNPSWSRQLGAPKSSDDV